MMATGSRDLLEGPMRRTVIGIVLAGALLSPACGMAAQKHPGASAPYFWWDGLAAWAARLIEIEVPQSAVESVSVPTTGGDKKTADPQTDAGTTWDGSGR